MSEGKQGMGGGNCCALELPALWVDTGLIDGAQGDSSGTVTKSRRGGAGLIKTLGLSHWFWLRFSFSLSTVREQHFQSFFLPFRDAGGRWKTSLSSQLTWALVLWDYGSVVRLSFSPFYLSKSWFLSQHWGRYSTVIYLFFLVEASTA